LNKVKCGDDRPDRAELFGIIGPHVIEQPENREAAGVKAHQSGYNPEPRFFIDLQVIQLDEDPVEKVSRDQVDKKAGDGEGLGLESIQPLYEVDIDQ
jgi:hypothetical protein